MKTFFIILISATLMTHAEGIDILKNFDELRRITHEVDFYQFTNRGHSEITLEMKMGDISVTNPAIIRNLKKETILKVELVYTDFPKGKSMDSLNMRRLEELYRQFPELFTMPMVEWQLIKQTGAVNRKQAEKAYHGFVFTIIEYQGFAYEKQEIEKMLSEGEVADSTIFKVFNRNRDWKNMYIIADVTGSMYPYTGELLLWLKLNMQKNTTKAFVFFNDDDDKSTNQEVAIDDFGMWETTSERFQKVFKTCLKAMEKGYHIENNLEAIFYTLKKYPEAENIVMIADNWEDPCDMHLLQELKAMRKPIHIVVCGINRIINTKYLDIAYATGGSIHTMEQDITKLMSLNEGQTIKIGSERYMIKDGKFVRVKMKIKLL